MGISYNPSVSTNGLVLAVDAANPKSYPGSGTGWSDLSGNANSGTLVNGPTFSSTDLGSIVFDGINNRVDIADSSTMRLVGKSEATVSAWFKRNGGLNATRSIFSVGAGGASVNKITINLSSTNNVRIGCRSVSTESQQVKDTIKTFTSNDWIFVVGTINLITQTVRIYVNGLEEPSTGTITFAQNTFSDEAVTRNTIGCQSGLINFFPGNISYVSLYNRALTEAEITQNFNASRGRYGI